MNDDIKLIENYMRDYCHDKDVFWAWHRIENLLSYTTPKETQQEQPQEIEKQIDFGVNYMNKISCKFTTNILLCLIEKQNEIIKSLNTITGREV